MTIDEIGWMLELFRTEKMSKAAENLYISQPALSQCVTRLERQLGFHLFERTSKGLKPTAKGQLFYNAASEITATYQRFLTQAALLDVKQLTDITIGMAPYMAYCSSVNIVRSLQERFPEISFHILEANTQQMTEALHNGQIQLIVTSYCEPRKELFLYPFARCHNGIFLRRGSPAAAAAYEQDGMRYLDPQYLYGEPLCVTRRGQASRHTADLIFEEARITPNIVVESRHVTSLYRYAQEGIATALCPITGETVRIDRECDESLIHLIPEHYENACSQLSIVALRNTEARIHSGIYDIIADCIISSDAFWCEAYRR